MSQGIRNVKIRKLWQILVLFAFMWLPALPINYQPLQAQNLSKHEDTRTDQLRDALTVDGVMQHLQQLEAIAAEHGNNRAAGTRGYRAAVDYLVATLRAAGYHVSLQPFTFDGYVELAAPQLSHPGDADVSFAEAEYATLQYSGSGQITAKVQAVDVTMPDGTTANTSTSGCEQDDFSTFQRGSIALLQRGTCPFAQKVNNAAGAGATAVLIFNEGQQGRTGLFAGTLGKSVAPDVPVLAVSHAIGQELLAQVENGEKFEVFVHTETLAGDIETVNVLAETRAGDPDNVVMVGGHFDSVSQGPGINDNGSGTATLLEIALQFAELETEPVNKIRFAFWSAEESGLHGSRYYVNNLEEHQPDQLDNIALYLNFDMIGSPNYIRGVYSLSRNAPAGTEQITKIFTDYFDQHALYWEPIAIGGRSDHAPFMRADIPVGGLFSGAENMLTPKQAQEYGHEGGGISTDPCYHRACDTLENISESALDELGDAAAHAIFILANDSELSGRWEEKSLAPPCPEFKRHRGRPY